MSPSPADTEFRASVENYAAAWSEIMRRVRKGDSWSGRERNCCYLNEGSGRFANTSYVSGLDSRDDGRALAVVDWDQDGDLDLWFRNRTAPRLRLMLNLHSRDSDGNSSDGDNSDSGDGFVAIKLEGTTSNRDGIGAVVEVVPESDSDVPKPRLVKSVRAGDLFLSQSSKWVHFGLGRIMRIEKVVVLWPGGRRESFGNVSSGNRYVLKQGTGTAALWRSPTAATAPALLSVGEVERATVVSSRPISAARIILPRKIPLPGLTYRDPAGRTKTVGRSSRPRLVLIWASWCSHCRDELKTLSQSAEVIRAAGLDLLALSVDDLNSKTVNHTANAYNLMDGLKFPFDWGLIDSPSLERVQLFQEALFDRTVSTTVPLAFLLDRQASATAVYRGPFTLEDVLEDVGRTVGATNKELHHLAPPLAGRWFTNPVEDAPMAEFMARQFQGRFPEDSLAYLHLAAERSTGEKKSRLRRELATKNHLLAREYERQKKPERAAAYFDAALQYSPNSAEIHNDFGVMLGSCGRLREAEEHFRQALAIKPDFNEARDGLERLRKLLKASSKKSGR